MVEGDALEPKLDGVAEVALYDDAGCARGVDGAVRCWKRGVTPAAVPGVEGATAVTVGRVMACAIVGGGSVRCWSPAISPAEPLKGIDHADEVGCGEAFCCARSQGTIQCWGGNGRGQLARANTGAVDRPVVIDGVAGARSLAVGWAHACAALTDGSVMCWGSGDELGYRIGAQCPAPRVPVKPTLISDRACRTPIRIGGVTHPLRLVAGFGTCALRGDAPPLCWGGNVTTYGADASVPEPAPFTW